jgi:hypothetical protein
MSQYPQQLCDALSRVLDKAALAQRRQLSGYVANIDFWIGEAEHRLNAIAGFVDRRRRMTQAASSEIVREGLRRPIEPAPHYEVSSDWEELETRSAELRSQVLKSVKRFVKAARREKLITDQDIFDIEDRVHASLRARDPVPH